MPSIEISDLDISRAIDGFRVVVLASEEAKELKF